MSEFMDIADLWTADEATEAHEWAKKQASPDHSNADDPELFKFSSSSAETLYGLTTQRIRTGIIKGANVSGYFFFRDMTLRIKKAVEESPETLTELANEIANAEIARLLKRKAELGKA